MSRRWKETSFLGGSRTSNVRVPFNVALEGDYENVHRSMGDLRPSRSRENRGPYYSPRSDGAPFTGSMGRIPTPGTAGSMGMIPTPGTAGSMGMIPTHGTEVTVSECKEIGVVEGNRRIPLASFQRDVVMAQDDNMRRAESMSTFTSSGLVRNTNVAGVSFASGWHEQRVVVDSERETSMIATRTAASSSRIHFSEGSQKRSSQIHSKPVKDEELIKRDYKMHVYGDSTDLCESYGFSSYSDSNSWKVPLDVHHPDINDHIYDEIRESDRFGQVKCETFKSCDNLQEDVQKPVIIDEYLKKTSFKDQDNYENVKSLAASDNRVHQRSSELIKKDVEKASDTDISKATLFQPISVCKSTPNLTTFSSFNSQISSSGATHEENPNVKNVDVHSDEKPDVVTCDAKSLGTEEEVQLPYQRKPYLETNLDDILWLPTPIKTDPQMKQPDDSIEANTIQAESPEMKLTLKSSAEYTSVVNEITDTQTKTDPTISIPDDDLSASIPGIVKPIETDQNKTECSEEYAVLPEKDLETSVKTIAPSDSLNNHYVADDIDMKTSVITEPKAETNSEILTVVDQNRHPLLKAETSEESFEESFTSENESSTNMITKTTAEELKINLNSSHMRSSNVSFTLERQRSRTSKKSVKRPSCPPPPPPAVKISSETDSLTRKECDAVIQDSDISASLSPDPSESTLNLAFLSDEKTLSENHEHDRLKPSSQDSSFSSVSGNYESSCMLPHSIIENTKEDKDEEDEKYKSTFLEEKKYSFGSEVLKENKIVSETVLQDISNDKTDELENVNSVREQYEVTVIGSDQYNAGNKETLNVMKLSNENVSEELAPLPKISDLDTRSDEDVLEAISDDSRSASVTLIDELPDNVTFEDNDPKEPPPYSPPPPPPPPPPESESPVVSSEMSPSDIEGRRSPSPPPRPPSPLTYTGPSTPPLYFSSPLPELQGTSLGYQIELLASLPGAEDIAILAQRILSHENDSRHSPSPPPVPPRPKHVGKFFYHPITSLDLHKHIYENVHHTQGKTVGHIGDTHSFKNNNCEDNEGIEEHDHDEILYENINSLQLQRDTLGKQDGSKSIDDECIYENIRGSSVCKDPMQDPEDQQECIYENVESLRDQDKKTRPTQGNVSGIKETSGLKVHGHYDENFLGHDYETIDKSHSKVDDTRLFKNQKRYHIYDTIRTDESEAEDHQIEKESKNHHERTYEHDKSSFEHQYATVNKTKLVDKTNASSSESSILNHTYAVIDRSQLGGSLDDKGNDQEEIYENVPRFSTHRNDEKSKSEPLQEDCFYENLGAFRKGFNDYKRENAGHSSRATVMSSFRSSSLPRPGDERSKTHEERPPTPPPRHKPAVKEMAYRSAYSPPPPPIPPFNPDAFLQMSEQMYFGDSNNFSSPRESNRGNVTLEKELFFDYQKEKELSYDYRSQVQELLHLQKQRRRWIKEMSRHQPQGQKESGNRAMMEFYVNNLTSDSDSDNDSGGTSASGGSHDLEEEEEEAHHHHHHQQQILDRTYQVIGGADTVLDTIEEDVEEDSGAESSGHWMFSADNTDTDSVIHVPAILDLRTYPVEAVKETDSTDSDGTLITEEDVTERVCCTEVAAGNNQRQEAGVTEGNSHVEGPHSLLHPRRNPRRSPPHGSGDSEEEEDNDLGSSRGVGTVTGGGVSDGSEKTYPSSEGKTDDSKGHAGLPRQSTKTMLSRSEATRLFEKRIDDVFDFESLESCESVYGGTDSTGFPLQGCASPLAGEEVVFNTSATSQPFADASGEFEDQIVNKRDIHESEVFSSNQVTELLSKDILGEACGRLPTTPHSLSGTPVQSKHDDAHRDSSFSELDKANGGQCNLDQTYVVGKSDDFELTGKTESTENDGKSRARGKDGEPLSMDLFGLPVRWTEGEKKGAHDDLTFVETPVASPTCLSLEAGQVGHLSEMNNQMNNHLNNEGECDELKYDSDVKYDSDAKSDRTCDEEIRSLTKSIVKEGERASDDDDDDNDRSESENEIATDNEQVSAAAPSEGDFTFTPVGETSSSSAAVEARHHHHQTAATGNLLRSSTDPEQLSVIASAEGEGEGSSDNNGTTVGSATNMREINLLSSSTGETRANYQSPPGLGPFAGAPRNDVRESTGGQPQHVKTTRHIENFSPFEGEISGNVDARCHQRLNYDKLQHQVHREVINGHPVGGDLASGDSDGDTDNTDGDYDEEDHFAAELSLRISTVHSEVNGKTRGEERTSYRNSDILSVLTNYRGEKREEEERVGHGDAPGTVSPLASQDGSSPEMPDSLRSSEGRSATRSVETLSEDSGLGDRDVRLTPSSPLPSISEGAPRGVVPDIVPTSSSNTNQGTLIEQSLTSVTARPKRQDIRQARIARARSCGDLRAHWASSDTDTEEEEESSNMRGLLHSRLRGREGSYSSAIAGEGAHNGGEMHYDKPFKSTYANYLKQQYEGEGTADDNRRNPASNLHSQLPHHPPSSRYQHRETRGSHPSEADGSDKENKSRYRRVREATSNHSRPRRYNSLLEFSSRDSNSASDYYYHKDGDRVPRVPPSRSASRRRPQPISVDLAEEFLSQERLGTTDQNISGTIRTSDDKLAVNNNTPSATGEGVGFGNSSSSCAVPTSNRMAHSELTTNGVEIGGGVMPPGSSQGSRGEEGLAKLKDEVTADVRVQCGWPLHASADSAAASAAASPTAPYPHHHPLDALHHHQQVSSTPPMPNRTPPGPPSQRQTHHQYSSSSSSSAQLPNECQPVRTSQSAGDIAIHDPIAQCDPSASSSNSLQENSQNYQQQQHKPSFVVSSNLSNTHSQRADGGEVMEEVPITRVRTKTYGSHGEVEVYLARADSGRPPPHPGAATQPVLTPTGGLENRTGSRGVTFSPSVKEVNWRESYYEVENEGEDVSDSVKSSEVIEVTSKEKYAMKNSVPQVGPVTQQQLQQQQQQEVVRSSQVSPVPPMQTNNKLNGGAFEHSTGSSSEAEAYDEKGHSPAQQQKPPTGPIWQRFKLPKISSPKSTRPKILPKPKNLSPRSSDTENSKQDTATTTPHESGSSTPSSPDSKLKKTPQSPKFFTWGSKREKKPREITRPKTPPPPVPRSSPPPALRSSPPPAPRASPPPPPPSPSSSPLPTQVSSGQVVGDQGAEAGKRVVSPSSVTLTGFNREGRSDASPVIISAKKREVVASDSDNTARIAPALLIAKKQQLRKSEPPLVTNSASSSYNSFSSSSSGKEDEWSDRRSRSVSSSGDDSGDAPTTPSSRSAVAKPPLPPPHLQRPHQTPQQQAFHKARLLSARRHYFSQERQTSAPERVSPPKDSREATGALESVVSVATRPLGTPPPTPPVSTFKSPTGTSSSSSSAANKSLLTKGNFDSSKNLKERFEKFSASTRAERERLARSTPDLSVLIESVRRPPRRIDSCTETAAAAAEDVHVASAAGASQASASDGEASIAAHAHQGASHTHSKPRQAIHERYKNRAQRIYARSRTQSTGVLETDLDTGASRELLTLRETNLDDLYKDLQHLLDSLPFGGAPTPTDSKARAKSLLDLEAAGSAMEGQLEAPARPSDTRAKSMEFLLDDGNKASVQPPENELMKGSERQLSEAELRVRRSLQRLDVPEWMKNAQPQQTGFLLRRRDYGSSSGGGGWSAYSSKTASMTSLGSSRAHTPNTPTKVVIPTRVASKVSSGLGGVTSPASNASISPSPSDRSGSLFQYPISRWSTSRLNSGTTTPTGSVTSTRTTPPTYVRQPYLGWRSQTSLASLAGSQSSLTNTGSYLTAADRLALGITSYSQRFVKPSVSAQDKENSSAQANAVVTKSDNEEMNEDASTNGSVKLQVPTDVADVHSSIKEVTSAIVHYCNESTPSPRASPRGSPRPEGPRAPSPRRLVWVESSFVGSRPITSPETPTSSTHAITPTSQLNGHEEPESNEAPSQPPQPPGEYLLAW